MRIDAIKMGSTVYNGTHAILYVYICIWGKRFPISYRKMCDMNACGATENLIKHLYSHFTYNQSYHFIHQNEHRYLFQWFNEFYFRFYTHTHTSPPSLSPCSVRFCQFIQICVLLTPHVSSFTTLSEKVIIFVYKTLKSIKLHHI